jgi:IS5 family transposase
MKKDIRENHKTSPRGMEEANKERRMLYLQIKRHKNINSPSN